jgi:hypothetical protein
MVVMIHVVQVAMGRFIPMAAVGTRHPHHSLQRRHDLFIVRPRGRMDPFIIAVVVAAANIIIDEIHLPACLLSLVRRRLLTPTWYR